MYISDLLGKREIKYENLIKGTLNNINWKKIHNTEPYYFFKFKDFDKDNKFGKGFKLNETFNLNNTGFETAKDNFIIKDQYDKVLELKSYIESFTVEEISQKYSISLIKANEVKKDIKNATCVKALYRPFDYKYTLISKNSGGVMFRPRFGTMKHFYNDNLAVIVGRQGQVVGGDEWNIVSITNTFVDTNIFYRGRGTVFPLYLYPEPNSQQSIEKIGDRTPNLNQEIVNEIAEKVDLTFTNEKKTTENTFAPIDILDYIYAILHSPTYREKYKEFLKIDFPRVPYPKNKDTFWQLVKLGGEIRQIHLLESPVVENYITQYPIDGDNVVIKPKYQDSKIHINDTQYFDNVPEVAWNFYIGGYQPAQKWLKDRKDRKLEFDDISHYQKIIVALSETDRLMKDIDKIEIE